MDNIRKRSTALAFQIGGLVITFLFITGLLLFAGAPPFEAYRLLWEGAVGNMNRFTGVLVVWVPLLLVTCGLLVTFTAGLWNIGIEGQITLGAIFTTGTIRLMMGTDIPPVLVIILSMIAGMFGGALWALLAGFLKTFGGVNEIFGGLGLNFVATALNIGLIFGAWSRPGVASMSGTEPFPEQYWLPVFSDYRASPWTVILAVAGLVIVYFLLRDTYFGLRLKAVGHNMKSAFRLGIPTWQHMLLAFILCGAFAGMAGATQVTGVFHRLIPAISSGYGFMGLMLAMLINFRAIYLAPVAFFFAALTIGGIQLPIVLRLDSALTGVLQGSLVLFVLIMEGVRQRVTQKR